MGLFSLSDKEKLDIAIETGYFAVIFETDINLNEDVRILNSPDNTKNYVLIRNKGTGGSSNIDIAHMATVKLIKGNEFSHKGDLGLPFEIDGDNNVHISSSANIPKNTSKLKKNDIKFVQLIVKDNIDDIREYWNLDRNNHDDVKRMKEIEDKICKKYGNKVSVIKSPPIV